MVGFYTTGNPILITPIWSYEIESENNQIRKLTILKANIPYCVYNVRGDVRRIMKHVFDLATGISEDLSSSYEIRDFLTMINSITNDLKNFNLDI